MLFFYASISRSWVPGSSRLLNSCNRKLPVSSSLLLPCFLAYFRGWSGNFGFALSCTYLAPARFVRCCGEYAARLHGSVLGWLLGESVQVGACFLLGVEGVEEHALLKLSVKQ
jgi:hypothetical protein